MARTCIREVAASVCLIAESAPEKPVAAMIRRICFRSVISFVANLLPDGDP